VPYFHSPAERATKTYFGDMTARTFWGEKMLVALLDLPAHSIVPLHSHPHEQVGMLLEGDLTYTVGDETRALKVGDVWIIPGGVEHTAIAGDHPVRVLDIFSPVREEYQY
jgi:quercetin dioxygenase-like cupin family protein